MGLLEIENTLLSLISKQSGLDLSELSIDMNITDTGMDSLEAVSLIFDVEEHFDITIEDSDEINERMNLGTISSLALRIQQELEKSLDSVDSTQ